MIAGAEGVTLALGPAPCDYRGAALKSSFGLKPLVVTTAAASQRLALGKGEPWFAKGPGNANKATLSARWGMSADGEPVEAGTVR